MKKPRNRRGRKRGETPRDGRGEPGALVSLVPFLLYFSRQSDGWERSMKFQIEDHGSITLVRPLTQAAREFLENNVSEESQWFGGALVVEPRYVHGLVALIIENGGEV